MTPLENISYSHQPGSIIDGKYQLEAMLGEGGMATVWKAQHIALRKAVAVKLMRPELRLGELTQRLVIEAQVEAQLSHPSIVRVSDFGQTEDGTAFMVMELLEGRSLAEEISRCGAMDPEQSVRLLMPVVDALACAHEAGIVHRDVKPENIFLAHADDVLRPKIVDFGIARLAGAGFDSRLTQRGMLLGSPAYMAPEQARGEEDVDFRSDIWSIAVVLYEMVTGRALFEGPNFQAVLRAVVEDDVRPLPVTNDAMITLWPILERALQKSRIQRYHSSREFGQALARWLLARGVATDICGASLEPMARLQPGEGAALRARSLDVAATGLAPRLVSFDRVSTRPDRLAAPPRRGFGSRALFGVAAAAAVATLALTGTSAPALDGAGSDVPATEQPPLPAQVEPQPAPSPSAPAALELDIPAADLDEERVEIAGSPRAPDQALLLHQARAEREAAMEIERGERSHSAPVPATRLGLKDPY